MLINADDEVLADGARLLQWRRWRPRAVGLARRSLQLAGDRPCGE